MHRAIVTVAMPPADQRASVEQQQLANWTFAGFAPSCDVQTKPEDILNGRDADRLHSVGKKHFVGIATWTGK